MGDIRINVNGCEHQLEVDERTPLIYILRNDLGLKGTKLGCGLEQCGACKVIVDGKAVFSSNSPVSSFANCYNYERDSSSLWNRHGNRHWEFDTFL